MNKNKPYGLVFSLIGTPGGTLFLRSKKQFVGRCFEQSRINSRLLLSSYYERTLWVFIPLRICQIIKKDPLGHFNYLVHREGLEPTTLCSEDRCSNPLSYRCI